MLLLIDNYDSFVHNLARYFERLGQATLVVRNDAIDAATAADASSRGPLVVEEILCMLSPLNEQRILHRGHRPDGPLGLLQQVAQAGRAEHSRALSRLSRQASVSLHASGRPTEAGHEGHFHDHLRAGRAGGND